MRVHERKIMFTHFFVRRNGMYNILICDDERDIVNALKIYLNDALLLYGYGNQI